MLQIVSRCKILLTLKELGVRTNLLLSSRSADLTDLVAGAFCNVPPLVHCIIPTAFPASNAEEWGCRYWYICQVADTRESGKLTWQNPFCCKILLGFVFVHTWQNPLSTIHFSTVLHNDRSRWFAISSLSPICSSNFSFMGGVEKKQKNIKLNWEVRNTFCKVTY